MCVCYFTNTSNTHQYMYNTIIFNHADSSRFQQTLVKRHRNWVIRNAHEQDWRPHRAPILLLSRNPSVPICQNNTGIDGGKISFMIHHIHHVSSVLIVLRVILFTSCLATPLQFPVRDLHPPRAGPEPFRRVLASLWNMARGCLHRPG